MKRFPIYLFVAVTLVLAACGNKKEKLEELGQRVDFLVRANEVDSLKQIYPDLKFDSLSFAEKYEGINIEDADDAGNIKINFGDVAWVKVQEKDGNFIIVESYGLGAFPREKYKTAKAAGMLDKAKTDNEIAELLDDDDFFEWLNEKALNETKNAVTVTPGSVSYSTKMDWDDYDEYTTFYKANKSVTVTNNSSHPVNGSDYSISYTAKHWTCCDYEKYIPSSRSKSGVDLEPGESKTITLTSDFSPYNKRPVIEGEVVKMKVSAEDAVDSFEPTGKEYQEYLRETGK